MNTGRKKWHYQTTPKDSWDYTATQNIILADITIGGKPHKVIMQAPKNGFFYVLDRVTGELLSAEPYTTVTWAKRVDLLKTGRPEFNPDADFYDKVKDSVAVGGRRAQLATNGLQPDNWPGLYSGA